MELADALTITVLGMAVVFSGLLLTALLIVVFGRVHAYVERSTSDTPEIAAEPVTPEPGRPVDPDIVCVVATVLEIERRLHRLEGRAGGAASEPGARQ